MYQWHGARLPDCDPAAGVMGIEIARGVLGNMHETEIDSALREIQHVLIAATPPDRRPGDLSRQFLNRHGVATGSRSRNFPDIVDKLFEAVRRQRKVKFSYRHFGKNKGTRVLVEPWSIITSDSGLFLLGHCEEDDESMYNGRRRMFKVSRIARVVMTADLFSYPPTSQYDPSALFEHCFGAFLPDEDHATPEDIQLVFAGKWEAFLSSDEVLPSQRQPVKQQDGQFKVECKAYVTLDLVRWLRGLGTDVEIVAPVRLRHWVTSQLGNEFLKRR